jgi:hypothetical protein
MTKIDRKREERRNIIMDNTNPVWWLGLHFPIIKTTSANLISEGKKVGWHVWEMIPPPATVKSSIHSTPLNVP